MLIPTIIMGILAVALLLIGHFRGEGQEITGMKLALGLTVEILPMIFFAFVIAGMVQVLIPQELLAKWIGEEAGLKGIFLGAVAGGLSPGGPYVNLPIAAGLLRAGAGAGTMVAFLTGWSLWAVSRLPMEVGILGWRFTLIRITCTFIFPPIAGIIAHTLFSGTKYTM